MEYKTIKELCSIVADCPHSSPVWTSSGKVVIRNNNIKNGRISFVSPSYTDDEHFSLRIRRVAPQEGDIVITREAPIGEVGMIPAGIECCLGQRQVLLRADADTCDAHYLLYALQAPFAQHQMSWSEGTGTTVSNLRIPHLEKLQIPYLPMSTQRKIAKVLHSIEEKIYINEQINDNLQQQAQALYDSYFVTYERSRAGGMKVDDIGEIPVGWKAVTLAEVTSNIRTRVGGRSCIVLSALNNGTLVPSEEYFSKRVYSKDTAKYIIVEPYDFAYNPARVNIGSIGMNCLGICGCVSPVYVVFRAEPDYQYFFDFFIKSGRFKEEAKVRASGSVRQSLNYADFGLIQVAYPPSETIHAFNSEYIPLLNHINHIIAENSALSEFRDTLLPRLLSGEIDVSAVPI